MVFFLAQWAMMWLLNGAKQMGFFTKKDTKDKRLNNTADLDDELDFDFNEFDDITEPETKNRKPIAKVASGIKEAVKSKAVDPSTYKKMLLNALPRDYEEVSNTLDDSYKKLSSAFGQAASDLKPEISKLSNKVDKLIPENQRILRKIYDKTLAKYKEDERESSPSKDVDIQQTQITAALNEVFGKQRDLDLAKESKQAAKEVIDDKIAHERFSTNFGITSSIDANLSAIRNYQDTVTQAFQKKTLELQYRSYFVQAETLRSLKEHHSEIRAENKSIVYNTSLPDFAKSTKYEKLRDVFQTKFGETLHGGLFSNKFVSNLTEQISEKLKSTVTSIKTGLSAIDMASSMGEGIDKYEMAGGVGGDMLADKIRDMGSGKLKKLIEKNPELAKKIATTGRKASNMVVGNTDAHVEELADKYLKVDYSKDGGIKTFIKEFFSDIVRGAMSSPDTVLEKTTSANDLYKPSVFTDKAHKSITEVIPGYLSKILREITVLRTGDNSTPTMMFDFKTSKFRTSTSIAKDVKEKLLRDVDNYGASARISNVTDKIAKDSPEETKKEVSSFIGNISKTRMVYNKDNIQKSEAYAKLSDEAKKTVDKYLDSLDEDEFNKADFEYHVSAIKNAYGDPRSALTEAMRYGQGDILENIGIVNRNKDSLYTLNMDKYNQLTSTEMKGDDIRETGEKDLVPNKQLSPVNIVQQKQVNTPVSINKESIKSLVTGLVTAIKAGKTPSKKAKTDKAPVLVTMSKQTISSIGDAIAKSIEAALGSISPSPQPNFALADSGKHHEDMKDTVNTNFSTLFDKLDSFMRIYSSHANAARSEFSNSTKMMHELIAKVGGIKFPTINIAAPTIDFNGLKGKALDLYNYLSEYDIPDEVKQKYIDAIASGKSTIEEVKDQVSGHYDKAKKKLKDMTLGDVAGRTMDTGKKYIGIARDITKGAYGKIKDASIDMFGKAKSFAKFAKDPVYNAMSKIFSTLTSFSEKTMEFGMDFLKNKLPKGLSSGYDMIKGFADKVNKIRMATDVYVKGEKEPRIQARLLRNGYYRLRETGEAIFSFKDIKGAIVDEEGNVILSNEDINKGLVDKDGEPLATPFEKLVNKSRKLLHAGFDRIKDAASALMGKLPLGGIGRNKRLDNMITILSQIRDILVYKFKVTAQMVPALDLKLSPLSDDKKDKTTMLDKFKAKAAKLADTVKNFFGFGKSKTDKEGTSAQEGNTTEESSGTGKGINLMKAGKTAIGLLSKGSNAIGSIKDKGIDLFNKLRGKDDEASDSENSGVDGSSGKEASGQTNTTRGKISGVLSKVKESRLGKLSSAIGSGARKGVSGALAGVKSFFGKSDDKKDEPEKEKEGSTKTIYRPVTGASSSSMADSIGYRKGSAAQRLAKIEEENKDKHKFKSADVKARYTGEGIFGMLGKIFDFAKSVMSIGGLSKLLGGVLGKIPGIGKLFGGAKAAGAAVDAAKGTAKKGVMRTIGGAALKGVGSVMKVGGLAIGANLALDALGAPDWLGNAVSGGIVANSIAGIFGSSLAGVATTAASGLLTVGSALLTGAAAIISSPVALTVLGVAAASYGAYKLYKHFTKNDLTDYQKIRYQQYGLNLDNETHIKKINYIKALEDYIIKDGIIISEGNVSLGNKIDTKKFFELVDIDPVANKDDANRFMDWFINRFKPFFLKHCVAIYKANPKYKLFDLEKLTNAEKLTYLSTIASDLDGPYNFSNAPYKDMDTLVNNKEVAKIYIEKMIDIAKNSGKKPAGAKNIENIKKELDAKAKNDQKVNQQTNKAIDAKLEKEKQDKAKAAAAAAEALNNKTPKPSDVIRPRDDGDFKNLPVANKTNVGLAEGDGGNKNTDVKTDGPNIPVTKELRLAIGPLRDGSKGQDFMTVSDKGVNIGGVNPLIRKNLLGMVEEYGELTGKKVIMTDGFRTYEEQAALHAKYPQKAAAPGRSMHEFGLAFDMDSKNTNELDALGLMRKYGFTRPIGQEPWHVEPIGLQVDINKAKQDNSFRETAINSSLYKGGGGYGTMEDAAKYRRKTDVSMEVLNAKAKEVDPLEILGKKANLKTADQPKPVPAVSGAKPGAATTPDTKQTAAATTTTAKPVAANAPIYSDTPKSNTGLTKVSHTPNIVRPESSIKRDNSDRWIRADNKLAGPTYSDTPTPAGLSNVKADKNLVSTIAKAGEKGGVDPAKLLTFAAVESDFNPNAKAGSSSATGLFQFTKATWNEVAPKAGVADSSPNDPYASSLAAAKYIKDNDTTVSKVVPQPGVLESYMAHFMGPGGAAKFLKASGDSIGAQILPSAAKSNSNIFYENGRALTVDEVKAKLRDKLSTKAKSYNIPVKIEGPSTPAGVVTKPGTTGTTPVAQTPATAEQNTPSTDPDTLVKRRKRPDLQPLVDEALKADNGKQAADPDTLVKRRKRPDLSDTVNSTPQTSSQQPISVPANDSPLYNKPKSILGDAPMATTPKQSVADNSVQDNYSKLVSDQMTTSLEYQKSMVKYLSSIDGNIAAALGKVLDNANSSKQPEQSNKFSDRQYKEPLTTPIDLRRKQSI